MKRKFSRLNKILKNKVARKNLKKVAYEMNKLYALADYLEIDKNEINIDVEDGPITYLETPKGTYWVMYEDEAKEELCTWVESYTSTMGITNSFSKSATSYIIKNCVDNDWFDEWYYNDCYDYVYELSDEEIIEQCSSYGIKVNFDKNGDFIGDIEELAEHLAEYKYDCCDSYAEEFLEYFGNDEFNSICEEYRLIDIQAVADYLEECEGYGHFLASYDGVEIELDGGLLAFRVD